LIDQIITFQVYAIFLISLLQPRLARVMPALTYGFMTLLHECLISDVNSFYYYTSAAIFDLITISLMSISRPIVSLTLKLSVMCVISVIANFYGWTLYYFYLNPISYDLAFIIIYAVVIYLMLSRESNVDRRPLDRGGISIYFRANSLFNNTRKSKKSP
jgi:hypothetical protein